MCPGLNRDPGKYIVNDGSHNIGQAPPSDAAPGTSSPFAIIWMFAAIVLCLLMLADFSFGLLTSVRASRHGGRSFQFCPAKDTIVCVGQRTDSFAKWRILSIGSSKSEHVDAVAGAD